MKRKAENIRTMSTINQARAQGGESSVLNYKWQRLLRER